MRLYVDVDIINLFMKNIFLNISTVIMLFKFMNKKATKKVSIALIIFNILLAVVHFVIKSNFDIVFSVMITYILQVIFLKCITKYRLSNILMGVIISMSLSYIMFTFAATIEFILQKFLSIDNKFTNALLSVIIYLSLMFMIFKLRKLRNGLGFLQNGNEYIDIVLFNISLIVFLVYGFVGSNYGKVFRNIYFYFTILGICMIITIQKILVMYYKQKLINDTINQYKEELAQKDNEIKKLTEEAFRVNKINHEFYNRQKSLELAVKNITAKSNVEAGEDLDIINRIHEITEEHSKKMNELKNLDELPKTDIKEIDDMFTYMQSECKKDNINFKLKVNGNIHYLVNNLIEKTKLETLIGDHIRDAIIAINFSGNTNKELFVILGIKSDTYELCIYDTGIEFEINTLLKLGLEPATTHKESGGTGIGFMTTFETLKETGASLIIEELEPENDTNYTKSVTIRFDGKCEYNIKSYRAEQIKKQDITKRANLKLI